MRPTPEVPGRLRLHDLMQHYCVLKFNSPLFFTDRIAIFRMTSDEVKHCPGFSNKQHKGNLGEGQFHLNQTTLDYHMNNHFVRWLTYEELYDLFLQMR